MNSWRRRKYESWLVPYADGTLDERRRTEMETYLSHDPALAADAKMQRRIAGRLRGAAVAEDVGAEAETSRLWPQIQARIQPKRRSTAPLVWAGSACAAACLSWAALWGPLSESSQTPVKPVLPAVVANAPANQRPGVNLAGPASHGRSRKPRQVMNKIARHARGSGAAATAPTAAERQELASAEGSAAMPTPPESPAPAPKPAVAVGGAARFQTAVGIHDNSPGSADSAPKSDMPSQNNAGSGPSAPDGNASDSVSRNVIPAAVVLSDAGAQKSATPHARKRLGRRHRRLRRHGAVLSAKTTPVTAQNASPPVDDAPKPVHINAKPVD